MPKVKGLWVPWKCTVKVKHLLEAHHSGSSIHDAMCRIGTVLTGYLVFSSFPDLQQFFEVRELEEANGLLVKLYDFADKELIEVV